MTLQFPGTDAFGWILFRVVGGKAVVDDESVAFWELVSVFLEEHEACRVKAFLL